MPEFPRTERHQAYMAAIRRRVCSVCLDQREDGTCRLGGRVCAIEGHLPRLVDAILAVHSTRMDEYVDAVRAQVCHSCRGQVPAGECALRDKGECALWTYLPLIVDAIEEVHQAPSEGRETH
jgi:hypothetical protein